MNSPGTYIIIFVVLFLLILWAVTQLQEIYDTWRFYKKQKQPYMAKDWITVNIQRLVLFTSLLIGCLIALLHWVALPTYYALYGG